MQLIFIFTGIKQVAFTLIVLRLLLITLLSIGCLPPLAAQTNTPYVSGVGNPSDIQGRFPSSAEGTPSAIDPLLLQSKYRFLDTFVDPEEYTVGAGDEFSLLFTSSDISNVTFEINSDGSLFIKSVGSIELGHISLKAAIEKITDRVGEIYSNTEFIVQLTGYRVCRINVIGQVRYPGIYYAPAIWRVSEVIELAGGITAQAAVRRIILRGLGMSYSADLVRFHGLGDLSANPMVSRGNVIEVQRRREGYGMVSVTGLVAKPGIIEHVAGDCLNEYLAFTGGTRGNPEDMEIMVTPGTGGEPERFDGAQKSTLDYEPIPGDNVKLVWKADRRHFGVVEIFGSVMRPGRYVISSNDFTVKDLLDFCGGISEDGNGDMIRVFRRNWRDATGLDPMNFNDSIGLSASGMDQVISGGIISYNPRAPLSFDEFLLVDGDSLFIPELSGMVAVSGAVASPGLVSYRKGKTVDYYLQQAGGLGFNADKSRMTVYNPATGARIEAARAGELFDGELLFVPQKESQTKP